MKDKPQRLLYVPIKGVPRLMGFPDAAYKNNSDGSSQCGQCIFTCQPRNRERDTKGSLIDYEPHKIKRTVLSTTVAELYAFTKCYSPALFYRGLWMDMTGQPIEVHLRTDANHLVTAAVLAQINADLVTGSSSSLSSSLSRSPSAERGVALRSRFSVAGSDAGYSDAVDGDCSAFGEACGIYRS